MNNQAPPNQPGDTQHLESTSQLPRTPNYCGRGGGKGRPRGSRAGGPNCHSTGNHAVTVDAIERLGPPSQESQASSTAGDFENPEDQTLTALTPSHQGPKKLHWTGPMEVMPLDLYVQEVKKGKQTNNGFQNTSHRHIAQQLREAFTETKQLLDYSKCKTKLNQLFKKYYDLFLACKESSEFGWDETLCEVTASDEVWERYCAVHLNARKFWGVPYPEFCNLDKIFGTSLATGKGSQSLSQRLLMETQLNDPKTSGDIVDRQNKPANSPTNYLSCGHKKDSVASAINGLVGFMDSRRL
ncbi:hypothetical protein PtB15_3B85 [Puccinia triticina]|nr:hypothetical protein PtB15_3B85 [Puccinia triticina]